LFCNLPHSTFTFSTYFTSVPCQCDGNCGANGDTVNTQSLAKRRGTTSLTTTAYSPKIFFKIIIATPAVKVY
ncbi:hypothetical protein L9F63_000212, partial [Diploptera punctata]